MLPLPSAAFRLGDLEGAWGGYSAILEAHPCHVSTLCNRSLAALKLGEWGALAGWAQPGPPGHVCLHRQLLTPPPCPAPTPLLLLLQAGRRLRWRMRMPRWTWRLQP